MPRIHYWCSRMAVYILLLRFIVERILFEHLSHGRYCLLLTPFATYYFVIYIDAWYFAASSAFSPSVYAYAINITLFVIITAISYLLSLFCYACFILLHWCWCFILLIAAICFILYYRDTFDRHTRCYWALLRSYYYYINNISLLMLRLLLHAIMFRFLILFFHI